MLSDDAAQVSGALIRHGYTPHDGLTIDQLSRDYLPYMPRDRLISAVQELDDAGQLQVLRHRSKQPLSVVPTARLREQ